MDHFNIIDEQCKGIHDIAASMKHHITAYTIHLFSHLSHYLTQVYVVGILSQFKCPTFVVSLLSYGTATHTCNPLSMIYLSTCLVSSHKLIECTCCVLCFYDVLCLYIIAYTNVMLIHLLYAVYVVAYLIKMLLV